MGGGKRSHTCVSYLSFCALELTSDHEFQPSVSPTPFARFPIRCFLAERTVC